MEIKKTITSIFMVPTLNIPKGVLKDNGFINAYIKDDNRDVQYDNSVYLLFQPKNVDKFREFLDTEYERTKNIIDDYDYPDGFVVVVYKLNTKFKDDFALIKKGKYSKTSPAFQKLFPDKVNFKVEGLNKEEWSIQYKVFNRTQDMIEYWENRLGVVFSEDQEVWHMFNEENESLDLDKIKQHV